MQAKSLESDISPQSHYIKDSLLVGLHYIYIYKFREELICVIGYITRKIIWGIHFAMISTQVVLVSCLVSQIPCTLVHDPKWSGIGSFVLQPLMVNGEGGKTRSTKMLDPQVEPGVRGGIVCLKKWGLKKHGKSQVLLMKVIVMVLWAQCAFLLLHICSSMYLSIEVWAVQQFPKTAARVTQVCIQ